MDKARIILDKYLLLHEIGRGGMAQVFYGVQLNLARPVAVKQIHTSLAKKRNYQRLFEKEAKILGSLEHENIVGIIDYGRDEENYFIIMNYVNGLSLRDLLDLSGVLPQRVALYIIKNVLFALEYAHSKGILHRDMKPSNILINAEGHVILADFGISGLNVEMDDEEELLGTPIYMAPEVMKNESSDKASDIFSIGLILAEVLLGSKVNGGMPTRELLANAVRGEPVEIEDIDGLLPPVFTRLIKDMLSLNPSQRPSPQEAIEVIEDYCSQKDGELTKRSMKAFVEELWDIWKRTIPEHETDLTTMEVRKLIDESKSLISRKEIRRKRRRIGIALFILLLLPLYMLGHSYLPLGIKTELSSDKHSILTKNYLGTTIWNYESPYILSDSILIGNVYGNRTPEIIFGVTDTTAGYDSTGSKGLHIFSKHGKKQIVLGDKSHANAFEPLALITLPGLNSESLIWKQYMPGPLGNGLFIDNLEEGLSFSWWFHGRVLEVLPDSEKIYVLAVNNDLGPVYTLSCLEVPNDSTCKDMHTIPYIQEDSLHSSCRGEQWLHILPYIPEPPRFTGKTGDRVTIDYNGQQLFVLSNGDLILNDTLIVAGEQLRRFWDVYVEISNSTDDSSMIAKALEISPNQFYETQIFFLAGRLQKEKSERLRLYQGGKFASEYPYLGVISPKLISFQQDFYEALAETKDFHSLKNEIMKTKITP